MDAPTTGCESTNSTCKAAIQSSPSPRTGDSAQATHPSRQTTKDRRPQDELPQEILDLVWNEVLAPWLKTRVIALNYVRSSNGRQLPPPSQTPFSSGEHLVLTCENPQDIEAGELAGNIRLANTKARDTVSLYLTNADRDMFPKRRDPSRMGLHGSFRGQHADFERDVFWLSRGFLDARLLYLASPHAFQVGGEGAGLHHDPPQPSHVMLSLRHMLAVMQMAFIGDTPCLGRRQSHPDAVGTLGVFYSLLETRPGGARHVRTLTALLLQNIDDWDGKVDYEVLEHVPFGASRGEIVSALGLATNQANRSQIMQVHLYWCLLIYLAGRRGVGLPALRFSRRRSWEEECMCASGAWCRG